MAPRTAPIRAIHHQTDDVPCPCGTGRLIRPDQFIGLQGNRRHIIESGVRQAHQLAPPADGNATGPVTTELFALFRPGCVLQSPL